MAVGHLETTAAVKGQIAITAGKDGVLLDHTPSSGMKNERNVDETTTPRQLSEPSDRLVSTLLFDTRRLTPFQRGFLHGVPFKPSPGQKPPRKAHSP